MTTDDLIALRLRIGSTQADMGRAMGLSLRAYQDIESASGPLKLRHQLSAERVALSEAVGQGDIAIAPASVRRDALTLAGLITGVDPLVSIDI